MDVRLERYPNEHGFEDAIMCITLKYPKEKNNPHRKLSPHYHDHIEILYGFSGTADVIIGTEHYKMSIGDMVIVNAKRPHEVLLIDGEVGYYVIKILPDALYLQGRSLANIRYLLQIWQHRLDTEPKVSSDELKSSGIGELIEEIISESKNQGDGFEAVIYANIMKMFVWMVRELGTNQPSKGAITSDLREALGHAVEAANRHLDSFTTEEAARVCNLSYSYFSRSFKKAYGISFSVYLESQRLREAERLLLTTDMSVTEIACATGFATTSYFIERFRRTYGTTPRAFRARLTK